jgi:RHS repeat-associated protein
MQARYQNPIRGQFISQDPVFWAVGDPEALKLLANQDQQVYLLNPQQLNSYSYANNNPVTLSDPNGRIVPLVIAAGLIVLTAYGSYQAGSDIANGYYSGNRGQLAWGIVGAASNLIPGAGVEKNAASLAKDAIKVGAGSTKNITAMVAAGSRYMDEFAESGFSSFSAFKREFGSAGSNQQWHHIVEQNSKNLSQFSTSAIHSPQNLVSLPTTVHQKITALYNTSVGGGQTLRDVISSLSFDNQFKIGQAIMKSFTETTLK